MRCMTSLTTSRRELQVLALLYYIASYFPGGAVGARFLFQMSWNVVARTFGACFQVFSR